jgi:hypothetical protein
VERSLGVVERVGHGGLLRGLQGESEEEVILCKLVRNWES